MGGLLAVARAEVKLRVRVGPVFEIKVPAGSGLVAALRLELEVVRHVDRRAVERGRHPAQIDPLVCIAALVVTGAGRDSPTLVLAKPIRVQNLCARVEGVRVAVLDSADGAGEEPPLMIERAPRGEVDGAADGVRIHIRSHALDDRDG
jgi:hypothetical protein